MSEKEHQNQHHFKRQVKKWAEYGIEYTPDMKGKSLQKELKKRGMTLADKIPDIAEDTTAIREGMATKGEHNKTNNMLVALCRKQGIEMEPDEPEPKKVEPKKVEPKEPKEPMKIEAKEPEKEEAKEPEEKEEAKEVEPQEPKDSMEIEA